MIKDSQAWASWEKKHSQKNPPCVADNLRLLDAMFEEAKALGVFPLLDPLQDLDVKIYLAKAINVSKAA